jgi:hypothetical protein
LGIPFGSVSPISINCSVSLRNAQSTSLSLQYVGMHELAYKNSIHKMFYNSEVAVIISEVPLVGTSHTVRMTASKLPRLFSKSRVFVTQEYILLNVYDLIAL